MRLGISEILVKADLAKKKSDKIKILQENYSAVLVTLLQHALDPKIKFLLPEGEPPYRPSMLTESQNMLYHEARKLYLFTNIGGRDDLTPFKRESLFIALLETVDPMDAKLLVAIKDKKLPYKTITPKLLHEAFPGAGFLEEATPDTGSSE